MSDDDNLFREVDADLRSERYAELWDKYGFIAICIGAAIVLGVAGTKGYEAWQQSRIEKAGAIFVESARTLDEKTDEKAEKALQKLANSGPDGYRILARLRLAGAAIKAGKPDEAVKLYDEIGKSAKAEPLIQDFARLQAATLRIDKADWSEIQTRLGTLTKPTSAWRHSARELLAVAAIKADKIDAAEAALFQALGDRGTPITMRARIEVLMNIANARSAAKGPKAKKPDEKPASKPAKSSKTDEAGGAEKPATQ